MRSCLSVAIIFLQFTHKGRKKWKIIKVFHKIIDKSTVITEVEAGTEPIVRKRKSITEPIINELSNYAMPMYQTQVLNTFLGMSYKESDIAKGGNNHLEIEKDDIVNNLKLKKNDVTAIINLQDLNNIKLDAKAKKTLCILLNMLSEKMPYKKYLSEETAIKYSKYTLSLNQYMKERGLTDRKSAKKQLEESLNLLLNINGNTTAEELLNFIILHK